MVLIQVVRDNPLLHVFLHKYDKFGYSLVDIDSLDAFLQQSGQKIAKAAFSSSCLFLVLKASNCEDNVPISSVLKFSSKLPISALVILLLQFLSLLKEHPFDFFLL
jgi:hypothetical protein